MDFTQLKAIYPHAQLKNSASTDLTVFSIPCGEQWIHINQTDLSTSEKKLLKTLFPTIKSNDSALINHFWYQFLWKKANLSTNHSGTYRIIQFEILTKEQQTDSTDWLDAFQSMFDQIEDAFFVTENYGILIQKEGTEGLGYEEISGIIQTLEDDFSIKSICYLGQYWQLNSIFPLLFNEEKAIFLQQKEKIKGLTVLSLSQTALPYYVKSATDQSKLMNELKKHFSDQLDWQELVKALWETQGNISMAAKSLYVHRNTLQYRMDRFTETTGFSLKNKDDLMLCYLLLL
ncbi:helix-turn-helix domain-containing protein [Carnobacterium gallinarum]|uniref:helix-turn-helix domain-containing protein n=1 Tax=Carnobacterium gallinarum TaxID=2749 RepID=UPI000557696C|nr:helix-turn-helix domain-containing protein [Carnobacterium gallinarum]